METKKVVLITGASAGIGWDTALLLNKHGFKVYGAARRLEAMKGLEKEGIEILPLDITDEGSIVKCVSIILEKEQRIDILINNAGYGSYGAVEDVPLEEARRQFEVNIFGLARLTQLVLPSMRANHYGKIVNVSSMAGKIYTKFGAWYHATKHALEGLSDCLRLETRGFGIDVIIVEPGGIKTDWGPIAAGNLRKTSGSGAYAAEALRSAAGMEKMYSSSQLSEVKVISRTILRAITARRPRYRYLKGYMAKPAVFVRKWFGDRIFDRIVGMM
ncbi:MAG: oxidoreductase [Bacteroidota bacterium]